MTTANTLVPEKTPPAIDSIRIPGIDGVIGLTSCPGMRDDYFVFDLYNESLVNDLKVIRAWGAAAVVTLLEESELNLLGVRELGKYVIAHNMVWLHLPLRNLSGPQHLGENWRGVVPCLCNLLRRGQRIVIHCKEGLCRAGLVAASLLIELGLPADEAISVVRKSRPGSLQLRSQEQYCHSLTTMMDAIH